ncbi:hypothetical protein O181_055802 [Austropuccinia psidii MF-1]|uniref:Uncharacterized protein n=1 Tax=Austropuccinia psidii MF-1 TaxID=1389203 RepID=A0A9Q3HTV3_9BASI|nr:hypothetical protein [Austropuccinia psidii MF-1]
MKKSEDRKETNDVTLHESDSEPSEEEELPDQLSTENINLFFEVTEVNTHLPQYSDECMYLIHLQDSKMQKTMPSRGKGYTARSSCITNIVINNKEAKRNLDSGALCTCVDKPYTNWQEQLIPIEGSKFSNASQDMHPLGILKAAMLFPHPAGSMRLKVEFVIMNNCTSQNFIIGTDYLNIYVIDINNHEDIYFTIGENKTQNFALSLEKKGITVIRQVINVNKEKYFSDQIIEAQIIPELTLDMQESLIGIILQYREAFASANESLGAIKVN